MFIEFKECNASSILKIKDNDDSIFSEITSIISLPSSSDLHGIDHGFLTRSCQVSSLKRNATKCVETDLLNLTQNVLSQKSSDLCVAISVTTLLRYAIKHDLEFEDNHGYYSTEAIVANLALVVYPQSMAGLNLNPKRKEEENQSCQIDVLLQRLCQKTYFMKSGWEIIRDLGYKEPFHQENNQNSLTKRERGMTIKSKSRHKKNLSTTTKKTTSGKNVSAEIWV